MAGQGSKRRTAPPAAAAPEEPSRPRLAFERPVTLVEQIVESFVRAAAQGRFLPGDRLNEGEIARELNVSRVPVREALRLLESQGIVVRNAHARGLSMMSVDAKHLHDILVVRSSLEQIAARDAVAAYKTDRRAFAKLESALQALERATLAGDGYEHAQADTAFHRALCAIGSNTVLLQIWESLARRLTIIFGLATLQKDLAGIYREHVELLDVLRTGSQAAIDTAVRHHVVEMTERNDFASFINAHRQPPTRKR
jgi:DNA-binding GntR family transcriptional regulator